MTGAPPARSLIRRIRGRSPAEIAAAAEAFVLVVLAAPAVRLLPFRVVGRLASIPIRNPVDDPSRRAVLLERIGWAVDVAARRSPLRAVCFERGLAAQIMARRRGVGTTLHYGARMTGSAELEAHVWVTCDGSDVQGAGIARDFGVLAVFPPVARGDEPGPRG